MRKLFLKINCLLGFHEWTCNAEQNIKPTKEQLKSIEGFRDYAVMYCVYCKKISKLSRRNQWKN